MKKIKTILYRVLPAFIFMYIMSCGKSFVDLTPKNIVPVSNFYRTEAEVQFAVTGAYGNLRGIYNSLWIYTELPSDNTQGLVESQSEMDILSWRPATSGLSTVWNDAYRTIADCNAVLDRISTIPMSDAARNQYTGEVKFIRSLMYFNIVRFFGDVPLVLNEIKTEAEAYTFTRTPVAQVYGQIEKDLLDAEKLLPNKHTGANIGRATAGAAKSLLGKAYLQQKKWASAETKLAEVITGANYTLLPNVAAVFGVGNDNNNEIIFAVQYVGGGFGEGNTFAYQFAPQPSGTTIVGVTAGSFNIGTQDLYDAFEPKDIRRDAYLGIFKNGTSANIYYWAKKFVYNIKQQNDGENDWPVIRYADVLLMYAEALNNNGKTNDALPYINRIRNRAGLPDLGNLSQTATQLAVEQERRVELCFEGYRWHDLIRWDKEVVTMQNYKTKYLTLNPFNANLSVTKERRLYPIPFREISLNPNLTQNPGY